MDPVKAKFFQAKFEIESHGSTLELRGLVSDSGITKIFAGTSLPDFWRNIIGKAVTVKLDTLVLPGILIQQFTDQGSFLEIRFRGVDQNMKNFLRARMATEGIAPGWQREFPRIAIGSPHDPDLPVPNLCMVRFEGEEIFANVLNFTVGGLRIETTATNLGALRVGAVIQFDLLTSNGEILANLSAEIRNFSDHEHTGQSATRSFGLRFVNWNSENQRKYRQLIKDYCLLLQKKLGEK